MRIVIEVNNIGDEPYNDAYGEIMLLIDKLNKIIGVKENGGGIDSLKTIRRSFIYSESNI